MKKALPLIILVVLALIALAIKKCNNNTANVKPAVTDIKQPVTTKKDTTTIKKDNKYTERGLNRNPSLINYSKHARCRMGCRHIDEAEVKEILKEGKINYNKSELQGDDCRKKYAVEGTTNDRQKVRIIFAPCSGEVTVVTVIDIGKEWPCDCE